MRPPRFGRTARKYRSRCLASVAAACPGLLAGAAVVAGAVVVVVELDAGADARNVGSVGALLHAIRTPASVVAATIVARSPRMVPYLPLYRRLP